MRQQTGPLASAVPWNAAGMQPWEPQLRSFRAWGISREAASQGSWGFGDQMLSGGTHLARESFVPAAGWIMHWRKSAKLGKVQEPSWYCV